MFRHLFYLTRAVLWVILAFWRANWHLARRAILQLGLPYPDLLTGKDVRRLQHYYYGTTFLSCVFCTLRGRWRSAEEKRLFTNLSALSFFFDDLVDDFKKHGPGDTQPADNQRVECASTDSNIYGFAKTSDERGLAVHFLHNVYRQLSENYMMEFRMFMHRVFEVQFEGRRQRDEGLQFADLQRLTAEKGGNSVLMFRRLLDHRLTKAEKLAIHEFGYLMQLSDDIFDCWHDRQAGIRTLATTAESASQMTQLFENQVVVVNAAFRRTPWPTLNIETSLRVIHGIVSVTRVCLRRYSALEKRLGYLPMDDRKAMVCDMEKWGNMARGAWFCLRRVA